MKYYRKHSLLKAMSFLLTVGIIFSILTCAVFAADETAEASEATVSQSTISSNAVEAITKQQEAAKAGYSGYYISERAAAETPSLPTSGTWSYSYKALEFDSATGYYLPSGNFIAEDLDKYDNGYTTDGAYRDSVLPKMFYNSAQGNKTVGIGIKDAVSAGNNAEIIMTASSSSEGRAQALTFTASKAGKVSVLSPSGISMKTAWTLNDDGEAIGLAVYKGETKIWPTDGDYAKITSSNIDTTEFPNISGIEVNEGEKLYFMLIPLKNNWGLFSFMPEVIYEEGADWAYSESPMSGDMPTGEWMQPSLMHVSKTSDAHTAIIPDYLAKKQGLNDGYGVLNGKVITYLNSSTSSGVGHAVALTYTAPKTGLISIGDPSGGTFSGALWGFGSGGYSGTVGFAVYKGTEKVWPLNQDYYAITANNVKFPEIYGINVNEGDKLHLALIPVNTGYSYIQLAPQVDYISFMNADYSAYSAVKAQEDTGTAQDFRVYDDQYWSYEERELTDSEVSLNGNSTAVKLPSGDYTEPVIKKGNWCSSSEEVRTDLPNMYYIWDSVGNNGRGLATYNSKVVLSIGSVLNRTSSLTYTAPFSGRLKLFDPDEGTINKLFVTLDNGEMVGLAIYKNNEKIWPAEDEAEIEGLYVFHGEVWNGDVMADGGNTSRLFPELNLDVTRGDKLRIEFVPLTETWGYMTLAPQVSYTTITESGWGNLPIAIDVDRGTLNYFTDEDYSFEVSLRRADGTVQELTAADYSASSEKAPSAAGTEQVTLSFTENEHTVSKTVNVNVFEKLYGDLNADTAIDASDMVILRKYLLGIKTNMHICVSDLNDDGSINIIDLVRFKKYFSDEGILGPKPENWVDAVSVDSSATPLTVSTGYFNSSEEWNETATETVTESSGGFNAIKGKVYRISDTQISIP